jgi:hypothetical protein
VKRIVISGLLPKSISGGIDTLAGRNDKGEGAGEAIFRPLVFCKVNVPNGRGRRCDANDP